MSNVFIFYWVYQKKFSSVLKCIFRSPPFSIKPYLQWAWEFAAILMQLSISKRKWSKIKLNQTPVLGAIC